MAGVERPLDPATMARIARAQRLINERVAGVSKAATETYEGALEKYLPLHLRTFGMTVLGDRSPITEENLTANERRQLAETHLRPGVEIMPDGSELYAADSYYDRSAPIQNTFGKFGVRVMPDGSGMVGDRYDFYGSGDEPDRKEVGAAERLRALLSIAKKGIGSYIENPNNPRPFDPGDKLPNAAVGGASRKVRIKLTPEEMRHIRRPASILSEDD
jgi:hypothetical protein